MINRKSWITIVVILGLVPAVLLCLGYKFVPGATDLADPLGRPSELSQGIIHSAGRFDELAGDLDPKHRELSQSIQTLNPVADDLAKLTGKAGELSPLAVALNAATTGIAGTAEGLPGKLDLLTKRSNGAAPVVRDLSGSIGGVTTQLESIHGELKTIKGSLATLGPRAKGIAATLAHVEEEAAHVQEMGPLLALLGPAVNGPKIPAPGPQK